MSAARNTPTRRCVWLDKPTRDKLEAISEWCSLNDEPDWAETLIGLTVDCDMSPADPVEAVAKAILESSRETNDEPDWDHESEWIKNGFREGEAAAVLRALGGFPLETT